MATDPGADEPSAGAMADGPRPDVSDDELDALADEIAGE